MIAANYDDLELLSVWVSPSKTEIAQFLHQAVADNVHRTLYYIDATNRFPLKEFQQTTSPNNKDIYDRIRITTCLDLSELAITVNRVVQVLSMNKLHHQQREKTKNESLSDSGPVEILLFLQGLEIMFRNTQLNSSPNESHLALRDLLLKLRTIANNSSDTSRLRTILTFPKEELLKFGNRSPNDNKRLRSRLVNGNTLGEYVAKFYADVVI